MKNKETHKHTYTHQKKKKNTLKTKLQTIVAYMQKTWRTKPKKQAQTEQFETKCLQKRFSFCTGHLLLDTGPALKCS